MGVNELLATNKEIELIRFSTAGSVDDGKSTLIGRLLHDSKMIYEDQLEMLEKSSKNAGEGEIDYALLTDGLKSEREQGITIDVAYRYFSTPKRKFIISDTPGHVQYTRNMATGASNCDVAVILVDAKNGVLIQSKRHAFITSLLGIKHVVVAVNKMDLVDYQQSVFDQVARDFMQFSTRLEFSSISIIPISALRGDNVVNKSEHMPWYNGITLMDYLENVYVAGNRNLVDFRFPVQLVSRPNRAFRGYAGTVASGVVKVGDRVTILPSEKESRVKEIVTYDASLEQAFASQAVTLTLEDEIDIGRGSMIVHSLNRPDIVRQFEAMIVWMSDLALDPSRQYIIKHTTNSIKGIFSKIHYKVDPENLSRFESNSVGLNDIARVDVSLLQAVVCDEYAKNRATGSFIVIDAFSHNTVAAGMVIKRLMHKTNVLKNKNLSTKVKSSNIVLQKGNISVKDRAKLLNQQPKTIWLTGLSGSGKSSIAYGLEKYLIENNNPCYVLDGDNIRFGLSADLGFAVEDRAENIRRVAQVARLFNDAGMVVISSFISPYEADRMLAKEIIGEDNFIEVFINTPLEVCEKRDVKGLYKKARAGEITSFTGIDAPYQQPSNPDIIISTTKNSVDLSVEKLFEEIKHCLSVD